MAKEGVFVPSEVMILEMKGAYKAVMKKYKRFAREYSPTTLRETPITNANTNSKLAERIEIAVSANGIRIL
jgi:hypothetical protein